MRVLILGAGGMLARDLLASAAPHHELLPLRRAEFDVTDEPAVTRIVKDFKPALILNAAAYTKVDLAETEQALAFAVNGDAPGAIGRAARLVGAHVVHFSTDYVFDGAAGDPYGEDLEPAPVGVYGRSKLAGERALAASGARYLILRTQWLFGFAGRSFPRTMWERARRGAAARVVNDQIGRPTYTVDLARATWRLIDIVSLFEPGSVLHVANTGTASWFDVAARVYARVGRQDLVSPCSTAEYPTAARRPAWSVLATRQFEAVAGYSLPPWTEALGTFLSELK